MKKSLVIILFLTVSLASFAQQSVVNHVETTRTELVTSKQPELKTTAISAEMKAKVLRINRKKNDAIISIKAYRKSLQIKVKTKKLC